MINNQEKLLFCFDVDGTIFKNSLHNCVERNLCRFYYRTKDERNKKIIQITDEFLSSEQLSWKNKEELTDLMKKILLAGHDIALVTFNNYPEAIKYAMEKLLGSDAEKIYIKSGLPAKEYKEIICCDKENYLKDTMKKFGINDTKNVFFMDDDPKNVITANKLGIKSVLVENTEKDYIEEALKYLAEFNELHNIDTTKTFIEQNHDDLAITGVLAIDKPDDVIYS